MPTRRDFHEEVHEVLNADTTHSLARKALDAVLDLHYNYAEGYCRECSRGKTLLKVQVPCPTVKAALKELGLS